MLNVEGGLTVSSGGGKFANGAITAAFAYAASARYGSSEDARVGGTAGETGDDAAVDLSTFPGVSTCGNSLCGNIPVECNGIAAACGLVMDKLATFARANSFNLTFTPATGWQEFWNHFFGGVLDVNFYAVNPESGFETAGRGGSGVLNLYGSYWQGQDPSIVAHEFSHNLGLGHNGAIGTLMYPIQYPHTPVTLQPGERTNLLKAYGQ